MFREALISYREALQQWMPILTVHVVVRLISVGILVPVIGFMLAVALTFSDQAALTDQDIARFLLTPAGAVGALIVGSFVLAAVVIDVAIMTAVLRSQAKGAIEPLRAALRFLVSVLPRLVFFAGHLLLRILLVVLPFVAFGGLVASYLLREYDINYYLSNHPPEFTLALAVGGASLAVMAIVLVQRLSSWAIALHLSVFDRVSPRKSFKLSSEKMHGFRLALLRRVVAWFLLRLAFAFLLVTVAGFLLAELPQLVDENLRAFFMVTAFLVTGWVILNTLKNAIANGALSDILNEEFDRYLEARPARSEIPAVGALPRHLAVPAGLVLLSLVSLLLGGLLSDRVGGVEDVQVIGHRGAAASRPENTMAAVVKAVEDGADWVEIDVQETADGDILVVHDSDFMKAAGVPTKVWDVTMADVAEIDIGSWFDPAYADERAPLLRDVLAAVKGRAKLLIELKYYGHDVDLENRVIALVEEAQMQDEIATMSLKYPAVQKMLALRPDWRTGVLAATAVGDLSGLEGDFIAVSSSRVSARLIVQANAADKDVYAWTVNDPATMSRMISMGVHGLITDEPKLAGEVIGYYKSLSTPERLMLRIGDSIGYSFDLTRAGSEI